VTRDQRVQYAARLLNHYFGTLFAEAGLNWDTDNLSEMTGLAETLIGEDD
jgi:hypothetical protein